MLQILTLVLAITLSGSTVPPQTVPGHIETPAVAAPSDSDTPTLAAEKPVNDGGCDPKCTY